MATWEETEKHAEEYKGGGNFIKLEDKEKIVFVPLGNPEIEEQVWKDGKSSPFTEEHKKAGVKPRVSYTLNAFVPDIGEVKILQMSNTAFKDFLNLKRKYGLEKYMIEMQRHGVGKNDTTYTFLPDKEISVELRKQMAALALHDLKQAKDDDSTNMSSADKKANGHAGAATPATNAKGGSDAPPTITLDQAKALVDRLRLLDKEKQGKFLQAMKTEKVKELPASMHAEALKYLDELEGKTTASPPAERDPFEI